MAREKGTASGEAIKEYFREFDNLEPRLQRAVILRQDILRTLTLLRMGEVEKAIESLEECEKTLSVQLQDLL